MTRRQYDCAVPIDGGRARCFHVTIGAAPYLDVDDDAGRQ
jgi:hypothetical protein